MLDECWVNFRWMLGGCWADVRWMLDGCWWMLSGC